MFEIRNFNGHEIFGNVRGFVLDDAYDIVHRKLYIEYAEKEKISYIVSQDIDINNLIFFPNIEYVSIPPDAENITSLYKLKNLRGIQISAKNMKSLDLSKFSKLDTLIVIGQVECMKNIWGVTKLNHLVCHDWSFENLTMLGELPIKTLTLTLCEKLKSLNGVNRLSNLSKLSIEYCKKLTDIKALLLIKDILRVLCISDCGKGNYHSVISNLTQLEELRISSD